MAYTITIELRVDFDTANVKVKNPAMLKIAKQMARELFTKAVLIQDRRAPMMAISDGDFFSEVNDVAVLDEQLGEESGSE